MLRERRAVLPCLRAGTGVAIAFRLGPETPPPQVVSVKETSLYAVAIGVAIGPRSVLSTSSWWWWDVPIAMVELNRSGFSMVGLNGSQLHPVTAVRMGGHC